MQIAKDTHRVTWLLAAALLAACARQAVGPGNDSFNTGANDAMARMSALMAACDKGDADRQFAQMMTAHHQGAIDMAVLELRYGKDATLRRLAQEIIVDQIQEIDVMRLATGRPPQPPMAAPTVQPVAADRARS